MKIAIVTDSITNLTKEDLGKYPFIRYVYLNVIINGKSYTDILEMDNARLFAAIDEGASYSTSQPSPQAFHNVYEELLKDHDFIFSLHCTENVSGTVNSGRLAKDMIEDGDSKIRVVDMNNASIGVENGVIQVAKAIADGKSLEDVRKVVEYYEHNSVLRLTIDDLSTLVKSGRMSKTKATIGNLLNIKPIIGFNSETKLDVVDKVRTRKKVVGWLVDALAKDVASRGPQIVRITHVNALDVAHTLKSLMEEQLGDQVEVHLSNEIGPVMAVHFGRGGFGASWIDRDIN